MENIFQLIIAFVAGGLLAFAVTFLSMKRSKVATPAEAELELKEYKKKVTEHFSKTARAVDQMTDSYKEVFEHLREGANSLLDEDNIRRELSDDSDEVITINRLGQRMNENTQATETTPTPTTEATD